jgi:hypothetical protein
MGRLPSILTLSRRRTFIGSQFTRSTAEILIARGKLHRRSSKGHREVALEFYKTNSPRYDVRPLIEWRATII